jgi:hypothetical protein
MDETQKEMMQVKEEADARRVNMTCSSAKIETSIHPKPRTKMEIVQAAAQ